MVPFRNRPLLWHTVQHLRHCGFRELIFLLYYKPEPIQQFFGDGSCFGLEVRYVVASEDYGTAGAVKTASEFVDDTCLVVSGDVLAEVDYGELLCFHRARRALLTMALTCVEDPTSYGNVETDAAGRIVRFVEKPAREELFGSSVNMGIYVLEPALLEEFPQRQWISFEREVFPALVEERRDFFAVELQGYWRDLGIIDQYLAAHRDASLGKWRDCPLGREDCDSGVLDSSIIGRDTRVHPEAKLHRSTVGERCDVGPRAVLEEVVLWDDVSVGEGARMRRCVVGSGSTIGAGARVEEMAVVGSNCHLGRGCLIGEGVRVGPGVSIPDHEEVRLEDREG
jgi:mannose-1-phosphate guanylyltransferase/phosphomannomutase